MIQKRLFLLYLLLTLISSTSIRAQFIRAYDLPGDREEMWDIKETLDGGFIMLGDVLNGLGTSSSTTYLYLNKTDGQGEVQWSHIYQGGDFDETFYASGEVFPLSDGGYLVFGLSISPDPGNLVAFKVDAFGQLLWKNEFTISADINSKCDVIQTEDGGYAAYFRTYEGTLFDTYGTIVKLDSLADTTWTKRWSTDLVGDLTQTIEATPDGGYTICGHNYESSTTTHRIVLSHIDSMGSLAWNRIYDAGQEDIQPYDMIRSQNGNYAVVGTEEDSIVSGSIYPNLSIYDSLGQRLSVHRYGTGQLAYKGEFQSILETPDKGYVIVGSTNPLLEALYMVKVDSQGVKEWENIIDVYGSDTLVFADVFVTSFTITSSGKYAIGLTEFLGYPQRLVLLDSTGNLVTNRVEGFVFQDTISNCQIDSLEQGFEEVILRFKDVQSSFTYFDLTDSSGFYEIELPNGSYIPEIASPTVYHDLSCTLFDTINVSGYEQDTLDYPFTITDYCPYNTVSVSSPFFTFNGPSSIYVEACNQGTMGSFSTIVEVELDSALSFIGANLTPSLVNGQTLVFDLDTLDVNECVFIHIHAQLDTLTQPGATHCIEAKIYPDTVCIQPTWAGARISASSSCKNDSIRFTLNNKGADMIASNTATVYIDDVIFKTVPFQLGGNESISIGMLADSGATYLIKAPQEPGFPGYLGDSAVVAFEEGCVSFADGTYNTGFIMQYYLGNNAPSEAIFCQENIAAYDPND
ncbi:MAG: hypothetical protein AAF789_08900, partial [Bacteroidota bacterium]